VNGSVHFWLGGGTGPGCFRQQENGDIESSNSRLRDELPNRELLVSIDEFRYVAHRWQMDYDHYWLHNKLGYTAPTAFAAMRLEQTSGALRLTHDREIKREALSQLHWHKKLGGPSPPAFSGPSYRDCGICSIGQGESRIV